MYSTHKLTDRSYSLRILTVAILSFPIFVGSAIAADVCVPSERVAKHLDDGYREYQKHNWLPAYRAFNVYYWMMVDSGRLQRAPSYMQELGEAMVYSSRQLVEAARENIQLREKVKILQAELINRGGVIYSGREMPSADPPPLRRHPPDVVNQ